MKCSGIYIINNFFKKMPFVLEKKIKTHKFQIFIGYHTWNLLHTIVAFYPNDPSPQQEQDVDTFFKLLSRLYPCQLCANDFAQL